MPPGEAVRQSSTEAVRVALVRRIFLFPDASQLLAALLPALESHILAPHQLLAVAFPADEVEESGFGLWVPAPEVAGDASHVARGTRVLLPWRFVATMTQYEDPGVEEGNHRHPVGFGRAERVG